MQVLVKQSIIKIQYNRYGTIRLPYTNAKFTIFVRRNKMVYDSCCPNMSLPKHRKQEFLKKKTNYKTSALFLSSWCWEL